MTVYSMIAAGATRYIRAKSAEQARVRAYKCWGVRPSSVVTCGGWTPDSVGIHGYRDWVTTSDISETRREYKPTPAAPSKRTAEKINHRAMQMAKLLGLA